MRPFLALVVLSIAVVVLSIAAAGAAPYKVLVFSKTAGYRHASIPQGVAAIKTLGEKSGFAADATEDAAVFRDDNLKQYAAVVFLSTTGDVLDEAQQQAFERYVRARAAASWACTPRATPSTTGPGTGGSWALTSRAIRRARPPATVRVADPSHPSTSALPGGLGADGRVVRLQGQPSRLGAGAAAPWTRRPTPGARWGTTTRSRGATTSTAAARSTPRSATPRRASRSPSSSTTCSAGSSTRRGAARSGGKWSGERHVEPPRPGR